MPKRISPMDITYCKRKRRPLLLHFMLEKTAQSNIPITFYKNAALLLK